MDYLIRSLLATEAVRFGEFTLASGQKSNYYINIKRATLNSRVLAEIASEIVYILPHNTEALAAPELGAVTILGGVLHNVYATSKKEVPSFVVRKAPKTHGTKSLVESGTDRTGLRTVVIEDVVTSGGSAARAVEILRQEKQEPVLVVAVVDREQGAAETFAKLSVPYKALLKASDILRLQAQT